jgi:predicted ATPase
VADRKAHPFDVPAIARLDQLDLGAAVTFFVGPNGSGKSTLLEALAVHQGMSAEGGSQNMLISTTDRGASTLHEHLVVTRTGSPRTRFFLRSESFFNVATAIDDYGVTYGFGSLHERSHGESFLDLVDHRFTPNGLYLLDEPEAALSIHGLFRLLVSIDDLVRAGCQFLIATHSPVLMAFPGATIYEFGEDGIGRVDWVDVDTVQLTRSFLDAPERFLVKLLAPPLDG